MSQKLKKIIVPSVAILAFAIVTGMSFVRDLHVKPDLLAPNPATLAPTQASTVTLTMDGYGTSPTEVSITSSNTQAVTVPTTVTVPTGENSVTFQATAVNQLPRAGARTSTITATANGGSASTTITVQ